MGNVIRVIDGRKYVRAYHSEPNAVEIAGEWLRPIDLGRKRKVVPCCMVGCGRPKYRETDPMACPGHYTRYRLRGWCQCEE